MSNHELNAIKSFAEAFAEKHLRNYIDQVSKGDHHWVRKEVNDPIWGTITLSPVEVVLVDSPLIQRLRDIRQLGVVHWVYPGAVHTRFEHTLGVLFQTQTLIQAINGLGNSPGAPLIDSSYEQILRIAAILHDAGHAAFSHVSEFALNEFPFIVEARNQFLDIHKGGLKQLSEINAYYIIRSPAFRKMTDYLFQKFDGFVSLTEKRDVNVQLFIEKVSDAVIGNRIIEEVPILHEMISGPFDADKLDYFIRDARNAGTPSVVDISRLIQKMTVKEFSAADLPEDIAKSVSAGPKSYYLFGVKWSGIPVLDELHLARVLLFSKVYKHGKVTAIEQMLSLAIGCLIKVFDIIGTIRIVYAKGDTQFLDYTTAELCQNAEKDEAHLSDDDRNSLHRFIALCDDLKHRRLHMKAFQVQRNYPDADATTSQKLEESVIEFIEDLDTQGGRAKIKREVAAYMAEIIKVVQGETVDSEDLETRISISVSGPTPGGTQIGRAFVIPDTGRPIKFSKYIVNRTAWANGYMSDQPMAYFFTEQGLADTLFVALERLLRTDYDLLLPKSGIASSKRIPERIEEIKRKLAVSDFYRGVPHDVRSVPSRLRKADIDPLLAELEAKMSVYEIPQTENENAGLSTSIDKQRIYRWLLQFEEDHRIECAIRCLKDLKIIRRADTVAAIKEFINLNEQFKGAPVLGFGDAKDSGSIQAYFAGDLLESYVGRVSSLHTEAERKQKATHVIFLDDFIGSGGQSKDILAAGLGMDEMRADLGEERGLFTAREIEFLESTKVGFVFTAGWASGKSELVKATEDFGIDATVHIDIAESEIPFCKLSPDDSLSEEQIDDFYEFCQKVGNSLILSSREDPKSATSIKKAENRKFGYGNRGMLLTSTSNTPTQSLTVLWASGDYNQLPWMPLLPRRSKR